MNDFFAIICPSLDIRSLVVHAPKTNPSRSLPVIEFLQIGNHLGIPIQKRNKLLQYLENSFSDIEVAPDNGLLTDDLYTFIRNKYQESNDNLSREYFSASLSPSVRTFNFNDLPPRAQHVPRYTPVLQKNHLIRLVQQLESEQKLPRMPPEHLPSLSQEALVERFYRQWLHASI